MSYILTLVCPPSSLDQSIVDHLSIIHPTPQLRWLSEQEAVEVTLPPAIRTPEQALIVHQQLTVALKYTPTDIFLTPSQHRKKKILIADMDSTIVASETLDELAVEVGIGDPIAAITKRAMNGEIAFAKALIERIALLKDVPASLLETTWEKTVLNKGATTLVATMKKHGAHTALISGGFTFFTQKVAEYCGFDENHANQLSIQKGKLDGTVIPPILGKEAKLFHLNRLINELKVPLQETMTIGDGANDLPMLTHAGLGIGYYPKPIVAEQVLNVIRHTNLRSALFIQGYNASEFVEPA